MKNPFGLGRALGACLVLAGCARPDLPPAVPPGATLPSDVGAAAPRRDGTVGSTQAVERSQTSYAAGRTDTGRTGSPGLYPAGADVSLDFADTDIREVTAQILGGLLHVNYTIDPAVKGTATLHTSVPLPRSELLPTLQVLLSQTGASLVRNGALYRVLPTAAAGGAPGLASSSGDTGDQVVTLRYASADQIARVLQPFAGTTAHIAGEPGSNAVIIAGEPAAREALASLVRAFDVDSLANQSIALLPVGDGNAKEFASALQQAMDVQGGGAGAAAGARAGLVHIVAMERINSVLVSAPDARTIDQARRIFTLVQRRRQVTVRSWHVYYLQNGRSNDVAYTLQQAFTPDHVTATPSASGQTKSANSQSGSSSGITGIGQGGAGGGGTGGIGGGSLGGLGSSGGGLGSGPIAGGASSGTTAATSGAASSANPLLGGLDAASGSGSSSGTDEIRIIPNKSNNALLVYGTPQEVDTITGMLRKIDILPLQVRIDAVIAEVELNDSLQYGTQFFFKSGGLNGTLTSVFNATNALSGYFLAGSNAAQVALTALQAVSTVHVLSSPELMVLDNEPARLEVGDLVPYLTQQSQSTVTASAAVVNSVSYEQTGVILQVTPRVNSDGLVTLDIAQEVSNVDTSATTSTAGISSPTFLQRDVQSRVVVQDGQTIGLAGLIQDSVTRSNQGIPFLKDIPLVGAVFGQQNNTRTRTELMVLITPHVVHDQRDALALTQDLREHLPSAANVPALLQGLRPSGSDDPNGKLRRAVGLEQ